ncbi:MAG: (2Fe-2S)-binding protein, partial [Anaerolineales bacterium]
DGVGGLVTITSGKWTTYRRMAEVTVDLVCSKLGVDRPCRTHLEPLPDTDRHGFHLVGSRLAQIERRGEYGRLVCECELATDEDVLHAIQQGQAKTIDDVRRDIRLGMGPCQGAFCTFRITGMLHELHHPPVEQSNVALRDFLQERWKGLLPILWGQQARQERLNELIYVSLLNAEALPGPLASNLGPDLYQPAEPEEHGENQSDEKAREKTKPASAAPPRQAIASTKPGVDVLVIGAGLSGLVCAWQ